MVLSRNVAQALLSVPIFKKVRRIDSARAVWSGATDKGHERRRGPDRRAACIKAEHSFVGSTLPKRFGAKRHNLWTFNLLTNSYSSKNLCANLPSGKSFPT